MYYIIYDHYLGRACLVTVNKEQSDEDIPYVGPLPDRNVMSEAIPDLHTAERLMLSTIASLHSNGLTPKMMVDQGVSPRAIGRMLAEIAQQQQQALDTQEALRHAQMEQALKSGGGPRRH